MSTDRAQGRGRLRVRWFLREPGPGFLTAAADDDPSNIATYSQVGAQLHYRLVWTLWFFYPLVAAVQDACARLAQATGQGLAANLRRHYGAGVACALVVSLLAANVINIAADLLAIGGAARLLFGGRRIVYAAAFAVLIITLEVWVPYRRYARVLAVLSLSLLAYVATAFAVDVDWHAAWRHMVPQWPSGHAAVMGLVAIAGTTISPYLFFWQAGQEAERVHEGAPSSCPASVRSERRRISADTYLGMALSQIIGFFIMVTAAATLGAHGMDHVDTAEQAARALAPLAGRFTFVVFAIGMVGTGLLSIPALAGASAYALAEMFGWRSGLGLPPAGAPRFYLAIALSVLCGLMLNGIPVDAMRALYLSAVLNGLVAVPILALTARLAERPAVAGAFASTSLQRALVWLATALMACAALLLLGDSVGL
ncbi:MAG: divalent metal cation transporter [Gammaproteobacteria bacterium]|nr:divalent metal cation transporter [Gammaproteobacteria bacterium]